jgi:peptidoglycan/xylan/chitin deacetylase (PgdA/CDA1 family)
LPGAVTCYEAGNYKHLERIDTTENVVYITFDDGPFRTGDDGYQATVQLLDIIKAWNLENSPQAHATFMVNGIRAEQDGDHESVTQTIVTEYHHKLGNHSYHHPQPFQNQSGDQIRHEVIRNRLVAIKILGNASDVTNLFRPPGEMGWPAQSPPQVPVNAIASAGHVTVVHTDDVQGYDSGMNQQQVFEQVRNKFLALSEAQRKGAIVLLHNGRPFTTEDVPSILDFFKDQGYTVQPLPTNVAPPRK